MSDPPRTPPLEIHQSLPSTQALCIARAGAGAPSGLAILARRQSGGHGRHGRAWQSPPGNLALSVLLRPATPLSALPGWSLLAAVALVEAIARTSAARPMLKWPNDLLLGEAKLGGILLNSAVEAGRCAWLVIGIGVNLAEAPHLADRPTACLAQCGPTPTAETLARAVLDRLVAWQARIEADGLAPVRTAWLAHAHPPGTALRLVGPPPAQGRFAGLAEDGALLLHTASGLMRVGSGEIERADPPDQSADNRG